MESHQTIIPVSRLKLTLLTLGALGFVIAGLFMIRQSILFFEPLAVLGIVVGVVSFSFFGACFLFGLFRLLNKKPGLIISNDGFSDNSSFLGGHFISWSDVIHIDHFSVQSQKFIRVFLKDPKTFIAERKGFQKFIMRMNYKFYGSPIHISANSLTCNFSELRTKFIDTWQSSKQ